MVARILGILFAVALLAGGGWAVQHYFIATTEAKEAPIHTVEVQVRDVRQLVHCVGEVEPALFTDLKAEVSGRIEKIHILEGDHVKKGDLLIELDRRELETQIVEAEHRIEAARLRMEKVKLDYMSKKDLRAKEFVSEREYLDSEIDYLLSQNELEIQRSQHLLLEEKLAKTKVLAPHDGVVLDHDLTEGMVITGVGSYSEGTILMRVAQLDQLQVETEISEVDVDRVKKGMVVNLNFDSLPGVELEGAVSFISPSAKPKDGTNSTNSKARVFPITIDFSAKNLRVRPGMTAQAKLIVEEATNVLAAELPGLFMENGSSVVYVQNGDSYDRRVIETGINDQRVIEIKTGVKEGDLIATVRPPGFEAPATNVREDRGGRGPGGYSGGGGSYRSRST